MANENKRAKFFYGDVQQSEVGIGNWIYINTRENVYDGKNSFSITLSFNDKYTKELISYLENLLETSMKSEEGSKLKWSRNPIPGYTEDDEGNITFKFNSKRKNKSGKLIQVPLYDSQGNPVDPMTNLMTGSKVIAMFQPAAYHASSTNNGLTLYLEELYLIEPKIYTGGAANKPKFKPVTGGYVSGDSSYETDESDEEFPE
jgi:hypothetical protein